MSFRTNNLKYFYFILSASALAIFLLIAYKIREGLGEKKSKLNESTPPPFSSKTPTDKNPDPIDSSRTNEEKLPKEIVEQKTEEESMKEIHDWVINDLKETKPGKSILKKSPVKNKINEEGVEKTTKLKEFDGKVLVRPFHDNETGNDWKENLNQKSREEFVEKEKERFLELKYSHFRDQNKDGDDKISIEKSDILENKIYYFKNNSDLFYEDFYFTFTDKTKDTNFRLFHGISEELSEQKNQPFLDKIIEFFYHLKNFKNLKDNLDFFNSNIDNLKKAFENDGYDFESEKAKDRIQNLDNILNEYNELITNLKNEKDILKTKENKIILYDYNIDGDIKLEDRKDYQNLLKITEKQRGLLEKAQKQVIDLNLPISFFANIQRRVKLHNISTQFILGEITNEQEQQNKNPNLK